MRRSVLLKLWVSVIILGVPLSSRVRASDIQDWGLLGNESTLEVLTVNFQGQEHWSTFWWVVIEGKIYLRLGTRGATRIQENRTKPFVSVKVGGQRFDDVRIVPTPEAAGAVADAMAKKYSLDLFIRWLPHPLTVRLERGV
jgi:hypothetical protein